MPHYLDSWLLFIHPPLAILGFLLATSLFFSLIMYQTRRSYRTVVKRIALATWLLSLFGLVAGMVWAQIAWGSYWSWDPKETSTLLFFMTLSCLLYASIRNYSRRRMMALGTILMGLMFITIVIPYVVESLHGYA
ncbi:MAG: cytochrome c biogenesis protein CcsA [Thermoplasmatota archaeon]